MLQLAIWGVAILLLVKGMEVLHRQASAANRGEEGAPALARATAGVAIIGAVALAYLASNSRSDNGTRRLLTYERHDEALEAGERFRKRMGDAAVPDDDVDTMTKSAR
jgi:hypothetical protein